MSEQTLAFVLDAPLQSWGATSRFQRRETESFPTKSGVLGLVAAALGLDKWAEDEESQLSPLAALKFSALRLPQKDAPLVQRLTDYHTIGGGYDQSTAMGKLSVPHKASGGPFGTVVTQRTYLAGAKFIVLLRGEGDLLNRIHAALADPLWGGWLGRKCCIPATPFGAEIASDPLAATKALLRRLGRDDDPALLQTASEAEADGVFRQPDEPVSFAQRSFKTRPVLRSKGIS